MSAVRVVCGARSPDLGQALQLDIFEFHQHRRAGVQLEGEDAFGGGLRRLLIDNVDRHPIVDKMHQMIAIGDHQIVVPFFLANIGLKFSGGSQLRDFNDFGLTVFFNDTGALTALGQDAASAFFIEDAAVGVTGLKVGLIATDHEIDRVN